MKKMSTEKTIDAARKGFEASFEEGEFYNRQTQDMKHLNQIIEVLHMQENSTILDLGTGTGYVSLEIAKRYKNVNIIGLDIVEKTLQVNRDIAVKQIQTEITFPRLKDDDTDYEKLIEEYDKDIVSGYQVHETQDGKYIYITQKVWNLSFIKT